jgi:hypothetical protein
MATGTSSHEQQRKRLFSSDVSEDDDDVHEVDEVGTSTESDDYSFRAPSMGKLNPVQYEKKLVDAIDWDNLETKEGVKDMFNKLVEYAVKKKPDGSQQADGPHMAVEHEVPSYIKGYEKLVRRVDSHLQSTNLGMYGPIVQYEILKHLFTTRGLLCDAHDTCVNRRLSDFFDSLTRVATNMLELTQELSIGWNHGLLPNKLGTHDPAVQDASFEQWMPIQPVFLKKALPFGDDVDVFLRQTGSKSDGRRAYPKVAGVDIDVFLANKPIFEACADAADNRKVLTDEERSQIETLATESKITEQEIAQQTRFDRKLQATIMLYGDMVKAYKEEGRFLLADPTDIEGVFILTSIQNNQSIHMATNNRATTWALKLLHEILKVHHIELKDKRFVRIQDSAVRTHAADLKRQRANNRSTHAPLMRASVGIVYMLSERMMVLIKKRHGAFWDKTLGTPYDVSTNRCKNCKETPARGGSFKCTCCAVQADALRRKCGVHKSDVASVPEYFQSNRSKPKDAMSACATPAMSHAQRSSNRALPCSDNERAALEKSCKLLEVLCGYKMCTTGTQETAVSLHELFGSNSESDDESEDEGANEADDEGANEADDEGEDLTKHADTLQWFQARTRMGHDDLVAKKIAPYIRTVQEAIAFAESCIRRHNAVVVEYKRILQQMDDDPEQLIGGNEYEVKQSAFKQAIVLVAHGIGETTQIVTRIVGAVDIWGWADQSPRVKHLAELRNVLAMLTEYKRTVLQHQQTDAGATFFDLFVKMGEAITKMCARVRPSSEGKSNADVERGLDADVDVDFMHVNGKDGHKPREWANNRLTAYHTQPSELCTRMITTIRWAFQQCCKGVRLDKNPNDYCHLGMNFTREYSFGVSAILAMLAIAYIDGFVSTTDAPTCTHAHESIFTIDGKRRRISIANVEVLRKIAKTPPGWTLICMLAEVANHIKCTYRIAKFGASTTCLDMTTEQAWLTLSPEPEPFLNIHTDRLPAFKEFCTKIKQEAVHYPSKCEWSFADDVEFKTATQFEKVATWVPELLNGNAGFIDMSGVRKRPTNRAGPARNDGEQLDIDKLKVQYFKLFYTHSMFGVSTTDTAHSPDRPLPCDTLASS